VTDTELTEHLHKLTGNGVCIMARAGERTIVVGTPSGDEQGVASMLAEMFAALHIIIAEMREAGCSHEFSSLVALETLRRNMLGREMSEDSEFTVRRYDGGGEGG
jgi:hypothetical protein